MGVAKVITEDLPLDNLVETAKQYFTGEVRKDISDEINEPIEKTDKAITATVPMLLQSMSHFSLSEGGAARLLGIIRQGGFDQIPSTPLPELPSPGLLSSLFGDKAQAITKTITTYSGIHAKSAAQLLGILSPLLLSFIGQKAKAFGYNSSSLLEFMRRQGNFAEAALPEPVSALLQKFSSLPQFDVEGEKRNQWFWPALFGVLLLAGLWLWRADRNPQGPLTPSEIIAPAMAPIDELTLFLQNEDRAQLPKRIIFSTLTFETNNADLTSDSTATLDALAQTMRDYPNLNIRIEGHTDDVGTPTTNRALSLLRAESVREELANRGIDRTRIETAGFGSENPIRSNDTEEGRGMNRRIEIIVTDF